MSVNIYVRTSKLPNVRGRVRYVSSPEKQEEKLLAVAGNFDAEFWKLLADECQAKFTPRERIIRRKDGTTAIRKDKCCEAREIVIDLPNEVLNWETEKQEALLWKLSDHLYKITGTENAIGLHDSHKKKINKDAKGNAHVHAVMAERVQLPEPVIKIAERNLFFDENGKRVYKKSAILDEDGLLRPGCTIVPKGAVVSEEHFASKENYMKDKRWLAELKEDLAEWINQEINPDQKRVVYDPCGPYLAQKHVGKFENTEKKEIETLLDRLNSWNTNVKIFNDYVRNGQITEEKAIEYKTRIELSPNQVMELVGVVAELELTRMPEGHPQRKVLTYYADNCVSCGRRTAITDDEEEKRKLRKLFGESKKAWNAYHAETDTAVKAIKKAEAMTISAEIERLQYELGYKTTPGTINRRNAVRKIASDAREGHIERTEARKEAYADKSAAGKKVSLAYDELKALRGWTEYRGDGSKVHHAGICRKANDPRIKAAQEKLDDARWEYQQEKEKVKIHKLAIRTENEYRALAMRLAADPKIPQDEVERAMKRYQKAVELLKNPEPGVVKQLHHELKALQKSQRIREEKRRAGLENKTKKGESVGTFNR